MNRRTFLAGGGATVVGGLAGCLGDDGGNADGYGPSFDSTPEERSIDPDSFELHTVDGTDVPLVPVDDTYYWYGLQEARMADARGSNQYDSVRIEGAVLSPAPDGGDNDPVADWPKDDRIITYCGCPHHLSGMRAASLIENGYEEVYAIDEGLQGWIDRGYPVAGSQADQNRQTYEIRGMSDPEYAGEMVWLEQIDAERYEAAPIDEKGWYTVELHYGGSADSRFRLETPEYTVEGTLTDLTSDVVSG